MSEVRTVKDARWSCQSCGSCCRGFSFGPIEEHIVQGLKEKEVHLHWPPAKKKWYIQHPKTQEYFFSHVDGHCIFLQPNNLCAIHARWGEKAKPWFCREYPFHVVEDKKGLSLTVREDCGGFHKSFQKGKLVSEHVEDILSIERMVARQQFSPSQVVILPGLGVSVDNWLQVEPIVLEHIQSDLSTSLRNVRQMLYTMAGRQEKSLSFPMEKVLQSIVHTFTMRIASLQLAPLLQENQQYILSMLENTKNLEVDPAVESYFVEIAKNRIVSKSFARLGSLPAGLGFLFLERSIFVHRGSLSIVGQDFSKWRRSIMLRPFWDVVRSMSVPLQNIFLGV